MAAIVYDASVDEDPEMVDAVRPRPTMALENERLLAESDARLVEVQASRQRIVAAGDAARRGLERDLHDGAQQRLVALSLQLRMIRSDIRRDPAQAEELAAAASDELAHSLAGAPRAGARASTRPRSTTAWPRRSSRWRPARR